MKTNNIIILLVLAVIGYFLYKKYIEKTDTPLSSIPVTTQSGSVTSSSRYPDEVIFPNVNSQAPVEEISSLQTPLKRYGNKFDFIKQELLQRLK